VTDRAGGGDLDFPCEGRIRETAAMHLDSGVTSGSAAPHPRCAQKLSGSAPLAVGEREQEAEASDGEGQQRERTVTPAS
jgi:hypothetical protein